MHYDAQAAKNMTIAEHRSAEIDAVIDATKDEAPLRAGRLFEHYAIAFLAIASRSQARRVLLSHAAYERLRTSGLLGFLGERYPQLTLVDSSTQPHGPKADLVIMDEVANL